jgi:DNA-binding response OmpR family regulator
MMFGLQHGPSGWRRNEPRRTEPKLLIVEDETSFAELLKRFLEEEGYLVEIAEGGEEGLPLAASGQFDAVLTDLYLRGLSGLDLIRRKCSVADLMRAGVF